MRIVEYLLLARGAPIGLVKQLVAKDNKDRYTHWLNLKWLNVKSERTSLYVCHYVLVFSK